MKQPRGVLLLLALVIMAVMVTTGLILGTIIVREVRLSALADKGITALYAAETAGEEAIYRVYKLGEDPTTLSVSGNFSNGATWGRETKITDRRFIFDLLPENATGEVNIYNNVNLDEAAGVESFSIDWTSGQDLEVTLMEWDGSALSEISSAPYTCSGAPCNPIVINTPTSNRAYQVLLTATGAPITDLIVNVYLNDGGSGDPVQVDIPVTVIATGTYQGSRQAIRLRVPTPAPWG